MEETIIQLMDGSQIIVNSKDLFWEQHEDFFSVIMRSYPNSKNTVHLFEDKSSVLSIIHSLKANRLIVMDGTTLEVLYKLADKWDVEDWLCLSIEKEIKERDKKKSEGAILNSFKFQCKNCKAGFNIFDNQSDSCKSHQCMFDAQGGVYHCCGGDRDSTCCVIGYHTPNVESVVCYNDLKKNIIRN